MKEQCLRVEFTYRAKQKLASSKEKKTPNAEAQAMGGSKLYQALLPISALVSNSVNAHKKLHESKGLNGHGFQNSSTTDRKCNYLLGITYVVL